MDEVHDLVKLKEDNSDLVLECSNLRSEVQLHISKLIRIKHDLHMSR